MPFVPNKAHMLYNSFCDFREPLPIEQMSAVKIQKNWKGFYVRKMELARTPGEFLYWNFTGWYAIYTTYGN